MAVIVLVISFFKANLNLRLNIINVSTPEERSFNTKPKISKLDL